MRVSGLTVASLTKVVVNTSRKFAWDQHPMDSIGRLDFRVFRVFRGRGRRQKNGVGCAGIKPAWSRGRKYLTKKV